MVAPFASSPPDTTLPGGDINVSVEETAYRGVIISALQVIQPGICVEVIATIAEGIEVGMVRRCAVIMVSGSKITPSIMYILPLFSPAVKKKPPRP